jgi:RsiW-degrading membrane proteinase PrsW (M82 family)
LKVVSQIKKLILLVSIVFVGILPFFYRVADRKDAPGVMVIGLAFVSIPFTAFIFTQIVEELFKSATELKSDSELTI